MVLVLLLGLIPPKYPKVVYNRCTGKYAVEVSPVAYFGRMEWWSAMRTNELILQMDSVFYGRKLKYYYDYGWVNLGREEQFDDSITAMKTYVEFVDEEKWVYYVDERDQKRRDSIYKCRHTYQ